MVHSLGLSGLEHVASLQCSSDGDAGLSNVLLHKLAKIR